MSLAYAKVETQTRVLPAVQAINKSGRGNLKRLSNATYENKAMSAVHELHMGCMAPFRYSGKDDAHWSISLGARDTE